MRWVVALLLLLGIAGGIAGGISGGIAGPAAAQDAAAPDVVVRESADPARGAVIGQHIALYVDVLFRGEMPRPPRVELPEAAGLQAFRFETQATTMSDTIGGEAYVGQRFEFALYPRRAGAFDIPPAQVTLLDSKGDPAGSAVGKTLRLEVSLPAGLDASEPVVATNRLTLQEQWDPAPSGGLRAGDAVVRTIIRIAEDVPGLAMRDLDVAAPEGVRTYADPPEVDDHVDRGVVTGRRVDRVTYLFERGGHFLLPAVTQPWWDLEGKAVRTAQARAVTVEVAAAPAVAEASPATTTGSLALRLGAVLLLIALLLGARYLLRRRRARGEAAERAAFAALRGACAAVDAGAVYRALSRWRSFLAPAQDEAARAAAARLDIALFAGRPSAWSIRDSRSLLARLDAIRRSTLPTSPEGPLPPLNPA